MVLNLILKIGGAMPFSLLVVETKDQAKDQLKDQVEDQLKDQLEDQLKDLEEGQ